jgi:hypothetical protein
MPKVAKLKRRKRTVAQLKWGEPSLQLCGNRYWLSHDNGFMIVCSETYFGIPMVKEYTIWERKWSHGKGAVDWWRFEQDRTVRSMARAKKFCEQRCLTNQESDV